MCPSTDIRARNRSTTVKTVLRRLADTDVGNANHKVRLSFLG